MVDTNGTLHTIATTAEAAVIGEINTPGGIVEKTGDCIVQDNRTSDWGTPHCITHDIVRAYIGPISSGSATIKVSIRGQWHYEKTSGEIATRTGLSTSSTVKFGVVSNLGDTSFSGPYWEETINSASGGEVERTSTFPAGYIMIEWTNDAYMTLPLDDVLKYGTIKYSVVLATCETIVSQYQEGHTYGNNKCIIKSELSTYGCQLKSPVPSNKNYTNNQAVEWYDLKKIES